MSIDYRKDIRTTEEFNEDIKDYTEREMYWGIILRHDFIERGKTCLIEESGVDNTGNLIIGKLPNYNADKIFKFSDGTKQYIEIKTIPENTKDFFTFKSFSLKSCVQQNAYILVPRSWVYYLLSPRACDYIYRNYPSKIYRGFEKPAKRIFTNEIQKLIDQKLILEKVWTEKAKSLIKANYHILFRRRKR